MPLPFRSLRRTSHTYSNEHRGRRNSLEIVFPAELASVSSSQSSTNYSFRSLAKFLCLQLPSVKETHTQARPLRAIHLLTVVHRCRRLSRPRRPLLLLINAHRKTILAYRSTARHIRRSAMRLFKIVAVCLSCATSDECHEQTHLRYQAMFLH